MIKILTKRAYKPQYFYNSDFIFRIAFVVFIE